MPKRIVTGTDSKLYEEAAAVYRRAVYPAALTGAGISVDSGIPDFRSRGGLWSVFSPGEYATIQAFLQAPEKAWRLFRALGEVIIGKKPSRGHRALAELEREAGLKAVVTQNIDGLHEAAHHRNVLEVHGENRHLVCLDCGTTRPFRPEDLQTQPYPRCDRCRFPLKPNIVLFGEPVSNLDAIYRILDRCDLLLVIGTSTQIEPVAAFPYDVLRGGGLVFEFNLRETRLSPVTQFFFKGRAEDTLPPFLRAVVGDSVSETD